MFMDYLENFYVAVRNNTTFCHIYNSFETLLIVPAFSKTAGTIWYAANIKSKIQLIKKIKTEVP